MGDDDCLKALCGPHSGGDRAPYRGGGQHTGIPSSYTPGTVPCVPCRAVLCIFAVPCSAVRGTQQPQSVHPTGSLPHVALSDCRNATSQAALVSLAAHMPSPVPLWPQTVVSLAHACWNKDPEARPDFGAALGALTSMLRVSGALGKSTCRCRERHRAEHHLYYHGSFEVAPALPHPVPPRLALTCPACLCSASDFSSPAPPHLGLSLPSFLPLGAGPPPVCTQGPHMDSARGAGGSCCS